MIRPALLAAVLLLPLLAGAHAFKCRDPASGRTLYTDQPCKGGELVVPARTDEDVQRDAEAAVQAREDAVRRQQAALERERQQLQAAQAAQASARVPPSPAESEACRAARAEASFRAASFAASPEEIRTARYNAALACGQPPPAELVVLPPIYGPAYARPRPQGSGGGFGLPVQRPTQPSRPDPRDEPIPVRVKPPGAR